MRSKVILRVFYFLQMKVFKMSLQAKYGQFHNKEYL
jgi:hypothetical protein